MALPDYVKGYEHQAAYNKGFLRVGTIHNIYYEQYGNQFGKPVLYLHGGPGGHCNPSNATFFNPLVFRVILLDQRGCGKSTPSAAHTVEENTSHELVSDLETLRTHLSIKKWHMVFGGSWGSTLSLLYAQTHPASVGSLVLRGIFLFRNIEFECLYRDVTPRLFPDLFARFRDYIPEEERGDLLAAYHRRFFGEDQAVRVQAALRWNSWEQAVGVLNQNEDTPEVHDIESTLTHARLEAHYAVNRAWLEEGQLVKEENINKIRDIPGYIVQGRYDVVAATQGAYDLHCAWPEAAVQMTIAGHSAGEPETRKALIEVCDQVSRSDYSR